MKEMAFLNKKLPRGASRQRGVGMIEVLVAITISAFALLGLAGLQMASLRYQKVANFRALASQYGADMADRIRANAFAVTAKNPTANYRTADGYSTIPSKPSCTDPSVSCANPQEVANKDIYQWRVALMNAMAGGGGTVSYPPDYDPSADDPKKREIEVTVYFNEPDKGAAVGSTVDPNCDRRLLPGDAEQQKSIRCFKTTVTP